MNIDKKYEAIVYVYKNKETGECYGGWHATKNEHDLYTFSSELGELQNAWCLGKLVRTVIWRGTSLECATLEAYMLKKVDAVNNPMWYNRNNGGGKYTLDIFKDLSEEARSTVDLYLEGKSIENSPNRKHRRQICNKSLVESIVNKIKRGEYTITEVSVYTLKMMKRLQIRSVVFDVDHVKEIQQEMENDPASARTRVRPCIILKDGDKTYFIDIDTLINGNHTVEAAHRASWTTLPAIYIDISEFENSLANVKHFSRLMNDVKFKEKGNSSDDCKKAILDIHEDAKKEQNIDYVMSSVEFKNVCIDELVPLFSSKQVVKNLAAILNDIEEKEFIDKFHFRKWEKQEIARKVDDIVFNSRGKVSAISIDSTSSYNDGIGAIINKMNSEGNTTGVIVVSYSSKSGYNRRIEDKKTLERNIESISSIFNISVQFLEAFEDMNPEQLVAA